jgi:hypothetical protein
LSKNISLGTNKVPLLPNDQTETEEGKIIELWYGTNRKLKNESNPLGGYDSKPDERLHCGQCNLYPGISSNWILEVTLVISSALRSG